MNCDQVAKLIAAGVRLPQEAIDHLETCRTCFELNEIGCDTELPPVDPRTEQRIIAAITTGLEPVRQLASSWIYVLATIAAAALVAAAGIAVLHTAGWSADTVVQRVYFTASVIVAIVISAVMVSQLMVPGAFLPVAARALILLSSVWLAAGTILYPAAYYDHFARIIAACLFIGLAHAAAASVLTFWIVRRGAFQSPVQMFSMIALTGGLAGFVVLFVFCPHRDLGHIALAHATVPAAAAAIGARIARGTQKSRPAPLGSGG